MRTSLSKWAFLQKSCRCRISILTEKATTIAMNRVVKGPAFTKPFRRALSWYSLLSVCAIVSRRIPPVACTTSLLPKIPIPVTILIPSYQRQKYLPRAIYSALNQSLKDIEVLVVDDKSTDSSVAIVESIIATDSRLRLVQHTFNSGTHAARVTGVLAAQGEYILSLDPDDELFPFIAEDALHYALLHDMDVVEFHVMEFVSNTAKQFKFMNPPFVMATTPEVIQLFIQHKLNWNLWKRLIRRRVYVAALNLLGPRIRAKRIIYAEDKLHISLVFMLANGCYFLQEPGYIYYRDNPENSESGSQQTKKECLRQLRYVERAIKFYYKHYENLTYEMGHLFPRRLMP
jgi:glycosyltransferase involved in cell wall biosynthesis